MARGPAAHTPADVVTQGRLARIRGQNILFSSAQRAVFALNDTAADIWASLEEGLPPDAFSSAIASSGVEPREAREYVDAALREWERLGLIRAAAPSESASPPGSVSQMVEIRGLSVRIVYPPACALPAAEVFRHLEVGGDDPDVLLQLVENGDRIHLFRNGDWLLSCSLDELPTLLKGELLAAVLERTDYELALHAAALVRNDRVLLLSGHPGAGKTTLTLALVHAGFAFAGDDVTLLDAEGHGVGLPFAPAVKAGSWPILSDCLPGLAAAPVFRRPDRKRVRYPVPAAFLRSSHPVGWVVLLRRGAATKARLEPVDPIGGFQGLLEGAFAAGHELTGTAFEVLTRLIGSAEVYSLSYSRLEDAVEVIRTMADGTRRQRA